MSIMNPRSALHRLGSLSPIALGSLYIVCVFAIAGIAEIVASSTPGSVLVRILSTTLPMLLFTTVTWFRRDDWLAAGVLITLIGYSSVAVYGMLMVMFRGGIGPAALWGAATTGGAIVYAIIFAPVVGGLVALARRLTPDSIRTAA